MADQLFYGSLYGTPQGSSSNSVIRVNGSVSGNTVTGTAVSGYLGLDSAAVGMVVRFGSNTRTITAVGVSSVTIDGASASYSGNIRISPAEGNYFVSASSFTDPNSELTVNDITGSSDTEFKAPAYAVLGQADGKVGRFHQYKVSQVVARDTVNGTISFFMDWNESGSEAGTGDSLAANLQYMSITEITDKLSLSPVFSRRVSNLTNLEAGADQAGYQIAAQGIDDIITGSFTGSFHGEFSGSLTGSLEGVGSGSFSGSYEGSLRSTDTIASGSFSGSYEGSVRSKDFVGTGSFSGSGHIDLADTASSADDFLIRDNATVRGNITVLGTGSFGFIHTLYTSASIIHSSGSTKFGDTNDDKHQFTGSIASQGGIVDFNRATEVQGAFSGSFRGDGNELTNLDFANFASLPTLLSSSAQISDDISGSFVAPSSSIDSRITSISSSVDTRITNVSSSLNTRITNVSSSIAADITSISSSQATDLGSLSSSIASDIEDIIDGTIQPLSASYALTASFIVDEGLDQELRVTGSISVSGSTDNPNDPALIVENGVLHLKNIPVYASDALAAAGGIPIGGIYRNGNFLIIRIV